jgi:hypothetical protein
VVPFDHGSHGEGKAFCLSTGNSSCPCLRGVKEQDPFILMGTNQDAGREVLFLATVFASERTLRNIAPYCKL